MSVLDMLLEAQNGQATGRLGQKFGIDETDARSASKALTPALMSGLRNSAGQGDGVQNLLNSMAAGSHDRYLDDPQAMTGPAAAVGNDVLGQIFGSKDVSRQVAARTAEQSGLGADVMKQMLPVAAMIMGAVSKGGGGTPYMGDVGGMVGHVLGGLFRR